VWRTGELRGLWGEEGKGRESEGIPAFRAGKPSHSPQLDLVDDQENGLTRGLASMKECGAFEYEQNSMSEQEEPMAPSVSRMSRDGTTSTIDGASTARPQVVNFNEYSLSIER